LVRHSKPLSPEVNLWSNTLKLSVNGATAAGGVLVLPEITTGMLDWFVAIVTGMLLAIVCWPRAASRTVNARALDAGNADAKTAGPFVPSVNCVVDICVPYMFLIANTVMDNVAVAESDCAVQLLFDVA